MPNMTLSIPQDLKEKMDQYKIINWSEVARQAIDQRIKDMEFLEEFKSTSTMTEKDAIRLGRKVNKGLAKRYGIR